MTWRDELNRLEHVIISAQFLTLYPIPVLFAIEHVINMYEQTCLY
jgi:hypothetical protein